jgi:predicted nucleotide-binding protein
MTAAHKIKTPRTARMDGAGKLVRVFIASSNEGKAFARVVADLIVSEGRREAATVLPWWSDDAFPSGDTIIDSLERCAIATTAALILATPDDKTIKRGHSQPQPRDNILLELGLFTARHGRHRCALAVVGNVSLPSDFDGVVHLKLRASQSLKAFRERNRGVIRRWITSVANEVRRLPPPPETVVPKFYRALISVLTKPRGASAATNDAIDQIAVELFGRISAAFEDDFGFRRMVGAMTQVHLQDCVSIRAVDVLGPSAWVNPAAYRYLALQIRHYLAANAGPTGFDIPVSNELADAIEHATLRRRHTAAKGATALTNLGPFRRGAPHCEYARILLWSKEELVNPVAESIIAIHTAFHVPLFYLEMPADARARQFDYISFETAKGARHGFVNRRSTGFRPEPLDNDRLPGRRSIGLHFASLLSSPHLRLASECRQELLP